MAKGLFEKCSRSSSSSRCSDRAGRSSPRRRALALPRCRAREGGPPPPAHALLLSPLSFLSPRDLSFHFFRRYRNPRSPSNRHCRRYTSPPSNRRWEYLRLVALYRLAEPHLRGRHRLFGIKGIPRLHRPEFVVDSDAVDLPPTSPTIQACSW